MQTNSENNRQDDKKKSKLNTTQILIGVAVVLILIWIFVKLFTPEVKQPVVVPAEIQPAVKVDTIKPEIKDTVAKTVPPPVKKVKVKKIPVLYFPEMENGNFTDCSNIRTQYDKELKTKLMITCGNNADVAVKIIDKTSDKSIRYFYVKKNTNFTITNIPDGSYYLKIAYGTDWGVMEGEPICSGRFTKNVAFEKGEDILDYKVTKNSAGKPLIPSYALKLNITYDSDSKMNEFSTNHIPEHDFYKE